MDDKFTIMIDADESEQRHFWVWGEKYKMLPRLVLLPEEGYVEIDEVRSSGFYLNNKQEVRAMIALLQKIEKEME